MTFTIDLEDKSVSMELQASMYSRDGIEIAAQVFGTRADVLLQDGGKHFGLTLRSKRKTVQNCELEQLGGEFLNELLNQEYRMIVGRFNRKISSLIVTQALFSARGGENPPARPSGEETPEFKAAVAQLLRDTQDEIRRTMPKKLPPQGTPLPPVKEEAGA
jgi:His-Xaa-Ser system protein HxsD